VFAGGEELGSFLGSSDGDVEGVRVQGTIIELDKFAGAGGEAGADGQGPEDAASAQRKLFPRGLGLKFDNIAVGSPGEKEEFVNIAEAQEFRFALRKPGVLGEFTERERAQGDDGDTGVFRGRSSASAAAGCGEETGMQVKRPRRVVVAGLRWK